MNLLPFAIQSSIITLFVLSVVLTVITAYWAHKSNKLFPLPEGILPSHLRMASIAGPVFQVAILLLQGTLAWGIMEFQVDRLEDLAPTTLARWVLYDVASLGIVLALFLFAAIQRDRLNYFKRLRSANGEGRSEQGDRAAAAGGGAVAGGGPERPPGSAELADDGSRP